MRPCTSPTCSSGHFIACFGCLEVQNIGFFDERTDPVGLLPGQTSRAYTGDYLVPASFRYCDSCNGFATGRQLINYRRVEVGVGGHRQRARNRRRRHNELVRVAMLGNAFFAQCNSLMNAETMLFVNNDKRELVKFDALLKQCMRADDELCTAIGDRLKRLASCYRALTAA